jgi:hypothetical protein
VIVNWTDRFVRATIGIMSASDAAPLPRLGEVFFDVRGNSRSMRLSWYADTGIAVFSIWQGGRCTGTFRLPIEDLARMTEILQRGPQRRRAGGRPEYDHGGYEPADYNEAGYEPAGYDEARYDEAGYDEDWYDEEEGSRPGGHGADEHDLTGGGYPDRPGANRPSAGRDSAGYDRSAGYGDSPGYERPARYDEAGYDRSASYADFPADARASDATGRYEFPAGAVRPGDGSYLPGAADDDGGAVTDLSRYGQQRFVPPYVRSGAESYANDNPATGAARRHGAGDPAYPADRTGASADPARYPLQPDSEAGYSGGSEYRQADDPGVGAQYSAGRHSGRRSRSSPAPPFAEPEPGTAGEPISERDYWSRQAR